MSKRDKDRAGAALSRKLSTPAPNVATKGREEWDSFVAELEQGMTLPRCFEHMRRWLVPSPETRSERNAGWIPLYDQILRKLSSDQRRHLDEELADWVDRLKGVARLVV